MNGTAMPPPYLECRIDAGCRAIIEAAAGTGKTHNIARIVARLIMERQDLTIDKMVIVTFTRAAAGELKTRIAQLLAELEEAVTADPEHELIQLAMKEKGIAADELRKRLRMALLNFDQAMIGTIHSFAMRSLKENSFNGKLKFEFTLNEGTSAIISELCNDFYRGFFYEKENNFLKPHLKKDFLQSYCFKRMANPQMQILWPENCVPDSRALWQQLETERSKAEELYAAAAAEEQSRNEIKKEKDSEAKKLPPRTPERKAANAIADAAKEAWREAKEYAAELKGKLTEIENKINSCIIAFQKEVCEKTFEFVSGEFARICNEKNFLGNDDLILKMRDSVQDEAFARQLQERFTVGLIDEFQDTNDTQFEIFEKIFLGNPSSTFIVVGDPRQAIYRFRNCDLNTYLAARTLMCEKENAQLFSMNLNRRSGKRYIDMLNLIFDRPNAFAMPDKDMKMPEQSALEDAQVLLEPGSGKEILTPIEAAIAPDGMSHDDIYDHCAADIYNMIQAGYQIPATEKSPARPVTFGDFAILTNGSWTTHGEKIRAALQKYNIPVRLMKSPNVFATPEALQLATFLEGILNFNNKDALLRALLTPIGDLSIDQLSSEEEIQIRTARLNELNTLWYKRSFMVMYNELTVLFDLPRRLGALAGGERSSANFNTIADILGEEAFMYKLTPRAVLNSLLKHINAAENNEKDSFRGTPETDQGTVIVDTVFGSKGLSYPMVFLPDLYNAGKKFDSNMLNNTFHLKDRLVYAPVGLENNKEMDGPSPATLEHNEMLQESLRIAYVALTRAKYYCRIYCGKGKSRCAATDWLFRDHGISDFSDLCETLKSASKATPLEPPVHCEYLPPEIPSGRFPNAPQEMLRRPDLQPFIVAQSGFLSFSSITPHGSHGSTLGSDKEDEPDSEDASPAPAEISLTAAQQLPGGTGFGNAIHGIMEFCDFTASEESLALQAGKMLSIYGISGKKYANDTAELLYTMLNAPIPDSEGGFFKFSELSPGERKSEFEFLYEFKNSFKTHTLFDFANSYFSEKFNIRVPEEPEESSTYDNGFFNGSIDLFFKHKGKYYIVDWKTNKLEVPALYANGKLKYAMAESRYYLQYMIYTAALFKYLKQRLGGGEDDEVLYDKYFGGVRYIFLRGFTGAEGQGIFSDRLSYADLKKLEEIIG